MASGRTRPDCYPCRVRHVLRLVWSRFDTRLRCQCTWVLYPTLTPNLTAEPRLVGIDRSPVHGILRPPAVPPSGCTRERLPAKVSGCIRPIQFDRSVVALSLHDEH